MTNEQERRTLAQTVTISGDQIIAVGSNDEIRALLGRRSGSHWLLAVTAGSGVHEVDSTEYPLSAGNWLWAKPGQVHRWRDTWSYEATVVSFDPALLKPHTLIAHAAAKSCTAMSWLPESPTQAHLLQVLRLLERQFSTTAPFPVQVRLEVWHSLLSVLLLTLAQLPEQQAQESARDALFALFHAAVERDYAHSHQVNDYATALGYSPRTLNRAVHAAVGKTAKQYIIGRVLVEAKRLLTYSELSAAEIAGRLGFSEPTNFGKFFERYTGLSPRAFRDGYRG